MEIMSNDETTLSSSGSREHDHEGGLDNSSKERVLFQDSSVDIAEGEESSEVQITIEATTENIVKIEKVQSYIRRWNEELELERRIRWRVERTHIVHEIVSTEETYVKGLATLISDIYEPVLLSQKTEDPLLEPSLFKSLFPEGHVKIIHTAHSEGIEKFRDKKNNWDQYQTIGDVFLYMCSFLRLYTKYAETYTEVEDTLELIKKEKKFAHFLKEKWPDRDPVVQLSSLLITPIQRIPRYQMLLESLYKKTWSTHMDYSALGTALEEMKKTAQHVNDKAKEADNAKKLVHIDNSLIGLKKSLVAANRKFVKEGFLHQRTDKGEWKKRYFFLFSDCMIRARPSRKQKGTYIFIEKVTLKKGVVSTNLGSDIEPEIDEDNRKRYFEFNQPHPVRYILMAATVEDRNDWCAAILRALSDVNESEREHEEVAKKYRCKKLIWPKI